MAQKHPVALGQRITAPLRWLRGSGGIKSTLTRAKRVYQKHGMAGLRDGLRRARESDNRLSAEAGGIPHRNNYKLWVEQFDTPDADAYQRAMQHLGRMNQPPTIAVVMPVYNPRPEWLDAAIASVRAQWYPHWQLCIADDASTDPRVREVLERHMAQDDRVMINWRTDNGHISAASNSALTLVSAPWVALLDHDDLLPVYALYRVAQALELNPQARLLYSDEDKINESGAREAPYFKCAWNPDLFYSQNMFSHLGVYDASLVREVGGFSLGMEGSQDYDLALRCLEKIPADKIEQAVVHIPYVLYHWRIHEQSTAKVAGDAKPYAMTAGERALNAHFERTGVAASAHLIDFGYRTQYQLPSRPPLVSIIIPTRNGLAMLRRCINSLLSRTNYQPFEILIVDNGSDDKKTLLWLQELASAKNPQGISIRVVRDDRPFNYSALNNAAVEQAAGDIVVLLNNDTEVMAPDWLGEMVSHALRPEIGAVGARLRYSNDRIQHAGVVLGIGGVAAHAHRGLSGVNHGYFGRASLISSFSAVTAACLAVRKASYLQVGGLDEAELAVGYNDVDFCLRLREIGLRNLYTPYAELYHHESVSRGSDSSGEAQQRLAREAEVMRQRWGGLLADDPAYSPNLTLEDDDFSLAWPPRTARI